ncbi:hypothetical protein Pcinc_017014 [Petrolisthes cinctipes]|uniref:KRAB-A domain-containing protein 2 n=1 Tax=Petrolisthes cinctipes TaxID=88211 RepID=A0AAE1FQA9_PETCI|nr:hypothetical protein Pcinc_017014 [Petrolisthes cinctipes]
MSFTSAEETFTWELKYLIPKTQYYDIIDSIKSAAAGINKKSRNDYYLMSRYDVLLCGNVWKLIKKRSSPDETPLYFVTIEDTFDVIKRVHVSTGHGGGDRMLKDLQKKYANVTTVALELFKSLCEECQKKRKRPMTKGVVVRPVLSKDRTSRGEVDLIDMQTMAHRNFKWIMKNSAHHSGIKCSPYSMFGCEARVGLTSSSLPQEVISRLESENDHLAATENASPETVNTTTSPATATDNHTTDSKFS